MNNKKLISIFCALGSIGTFIYSGYAFMTSEDKYDISSDVLYSLIGTICFGTIAYQLYSNDDHSEYTLIGDSKAPCLSDL